MRQARTASAVSAVSAVIAQLAVLAALNAGAGLTVRGWLIGGACGLATSCGLHCGRLRTGAAVLGPANRVTVLRAALVGGIAALVVDGFARPVPVAVVVPLAGVALALDAMDGWVARRTGTASALGARFDMEVDAFLILMLSVDVARSTGTWVLAIGAARYVFAAAGWLLPWLRAPMPPRYWAKVVAATQGVVLTVAVAHVLSGAGLVALLIASLALLVDSFSRQVVWLWRHRTVGPTRPVEAPRELALAGPR